MRNIKREGEKNNREIWKREKMKKEGK